MNQDDIIEIMADKTKKFNYVYVKNISIKMSEEELKELFEPYGKITRLKVCKRLANLKHDILNVTKLFKATVKCS